MKIILSPSKSQNESVVSSVKYQSTKPLFQHQAFELLSYIKEYSLPELLKLYAVSEKKLEKISDTLNQKNPLEIPALFLYSGTSFKELSVSTYNKKQQQYIKDHLLILSALYGILRPFDTVSNYRLDMNHNIVKKHGFKNMYTFWNQYVLDYFQEKEIVINLASREYSKILDTCKNITVINIHFEVLKNNTRKSVAIYSKQQRGKLLHYCIENNITDYSELRSYSSDGFQYDSLISNQRNLFFIKK